MFWSAVESQSQNFTEEIAKILNKLLYCGLLGCTTVYYSTASIIPTTGTENSSGASVLVYCEIFASQKTTTWIIRHYAENLMPVITFIFTDNLLDLHWSNIGTQKDLLLCIFLKHLLYSHRSTTVQEWLPCSIMIWKQPKMLWYHICAFWLLLYVLAIHGYLLSWFDNI